ncbi:Endonuclease/exonuclease/phosphatase [Coprinopsis sp. MPI-PUGE-AT-0042]|nr:Endonuclease/exonuclease/phosphatase [Coprinopsis sp. MPI-PUGE-AT-0042]
MSETGQTRQINWTSRIQPFLRSTDELRVVLEASWVPPSTSPSGRRIDEGPKHRRVLAVVSHKDDWDLTEEGCVFIFQPKSASAGRTVSAEDELELHRVLPIYGAFAIVMSQMQRRSTIDMRALHSGSGSVDLGAGAAGFSLAITPGEGLSSQAGTLNHDGGDTKAKPELFYIRDAQEELREFVKECKRLKEEAGSRISLVSTSAVMTAGATHFSWLRPYVLHMNREIPFVLRSRIPPDLRLANLPMNERLSKTSAGGGITGPAGNEGREQSDLEVMRDDWVRREARKVALEGPEIRIGTFNVNGKNPSQDLSSWVQGGFTSGTKSQTHTATTGLPQIATVSPLSIGEITSAGVRHEEVNPFDADPEGKGQSEGREGLPIDQGSIAPTMLVLGFQELDLSTEALIYNTGPAKEDAWVMACIAGLGENGDEWEKVSFKPMSLASKQLVGMLIVILVKKQSRFYFGDVQCISAGTGVMGVMGNKGASAIRVSYYPPPHKHDGTRKRRRMKPTILTFVNAHLAAFDEMVDKRNADYRELTRRLRFNAPTRHAQPHDEEADEEEEGEAIETTSVFESDVLFWLGDLNYRIDIPDIPLRRILRDDEWANPDKFETLRRFDQLHKAMEQKKAFVGFLESKITHLPCVSFSLFVSRPFSGSFPPPPAAWATKAVCRQSNFKCSRSKALG